MDTLARSPWGSGTVAGRRCRLVLVLDVSGSMIEHLGSVHTGMSAMLHRLRQCGETAAGIDVGVVTFGDEARVAMEFTAVAEARVPYLESEAETYLGKGLACAFGLLDRPRTGFMVTQKEAKPVVLVVSDGAASDDVTAIAYEIRRREAQGTVAVYGVGIGEAGVASMARIVQRPVMSLDGVELRQMFEWLAVGMSRHLRGDRLPDVPVQFRRDRRA